MRVSVRPLHMHRLKLIVIIALTVIMVVLVELHVHGVNGPWYGVIAWRRYPVAKTYLMMLGAAMPTVAAVLLHSHLKKLRAILLLLPMLGAMAGKLAFAELRSAPGAPLGFVFAAVEDPLATSYYIDAVALSNFPGWLADFPRIMPMLNLHSKTKAPGMILYYMAFIKTLGHSDRTALIAGVTLGAIATLSIPACYALLRVMRESEDEAFFGACFLSLCPGFLLFFPVSDPAYTILSCLAGICWILALKRDSAWFAAATGLVAAAILVVSFNLLVFGIFLLAYALLISRRPTRVFIRHALIALITCAAICGILWLATAYNPLATFESAWRNQHALLAEHPHDRPYPNTAWNDLLDFALGAGWIGFLLAGFGAAEVMRRGWKDPSVRLVVLCLALPIAVAISALLAAETARVWNFMLPLLMVPIGIELARFQTARRLVTFACLALIVAAVCRNMSIFM